MSPKRKMKEKNKHTHGFTTPKEYFESFDERLFDTLELENLPKESGFATPDGYFDTVEDKILEQLAEEKPAKVISLFKRKTFIYAASIAACIALVTIFSGQDPDTIENLEFADIETYFDEEGIGFNSYELAQYLPEEELEELDLSSDLFSAENLESYLLETIDDTTLLIE